MDENERAFLRAAGEKMLAGHRELRAQLADVQAALAGEDLPLTARLRLRCLSYCQGLHHHHTMEDGAFGLIEQAVPEVAPVLARLRREHVKVARALGRMEAILGGEGLRTAATRRELAETIAGLEAHFAYEEEHLLPALGVPRPAGTP